METASTFRERAGVIAAYMIIAAYVAIGFVQFVLGWWSGVEMAFDAAWAGSMNGLAGGALGFLIGKQTTNGPSVTASLGAGDAGSASATVTGAADKKPLGA